MNGPGRIPGAASREELLEAYADALEEAAGADPRAVAAVRARFLARRRDLGLPETAADPGEGAEVRPEFGERLRRPSPAERRRARLRMAAIGAAAILVIAALVLLRLHLYREGAAQ